MSKLELTEKKCSKCLLVRDIGMFYGRSDKPHLFSSQCKVCLFGYKGQDFNHSGKLNPMFGKKHKPETLEKMRGRVVSDETRLKQSVARCGEKSPWWKGGITDVLEKERRTVKYKIWRKAVLERDNRTCVLCGVSGVPIQVDHIKPFSLFPELRFEIGNGRVLCIPCHKQTDTYGGKIKNIKLENYAS